MEEESEPKPNESKKAIYPPLETLLTVIQKEYEYESDRAKSFENRTGFLLSFAGALMVFLLTNSKFPNTIVQKLNTFRAIIPYSILIITIALTFLTIIASVFCFIRVVSIGKYNRINVNNVTPIFAKGEKEAIEMGLLLDYKNAILSNINVNDKKANWYKNGLFLISISLGFTIITYIVSFLLS